jgi:protein O-mannosyl-transferase
MHVEPSRQEDRTLRRTRVRAWVFGVLVLVMTAAVFSPVLGHHFIEAWDDSTAILTNRDYNPPTFGKLAHYWVPPPTETFYVPVTYTLWGLLAMASRSTAPPGLPFNPAFFYAANLVAHLLSVALVFVILRRLVRWPWPAAVGAALFALHPIQVEAVCNAWSVYTPLSGFFSFVAIWQYLIFSDQRHSDPPARGRANVHYALATLAFVLGMMTKPTAVSVPLMIAAIEFFLRGRDVRQWVLPLAPWAALGLVFVWLNLHAAPGATVFVPDLPWRPLVPLDAIAFYLGKVLWPAGLVMDYARSPKWLMGHPVAWLTAIVAPVLGWICWRQRHRAPWLAAGFGVFVAGLLPTIGIVPFGFQRYSTVADRYAYPAMLGVAIAAAFVVCRLAKRALVPFVLALLAWLGVLSVLQGRHWRDDWQVAAYTLKTNPQSKAGVAMFRYLVSRAGHFDPPDHPFPASKLCSLNEPALMASADCLRDKRFWDVAAGLYREAIRQNDRSAAAYAGLGAALLQGQEHADAERACRKALQLDPDNPLARRTLAKLSGAVTRPRPLTAPSR